MPSMWLISALPLGMRASNSSSTRGRPAVMSRPGDAAGVERPHRQLRAGLADRLGGDDADRLTRADHLAGGEVAAVARPADAVAGLARERRADEHLVDAGLVDARRRLLGDHLVALDEERRLLALLGLDARIGQRRRGEPADETALEGALLVARLGRG